MTQRCPCGKFTPARKVWAGFNRILSVESEPDRFEAAKALMTKRLRLEVAWHRIWKARMV